MLFFCLQQDNAELVISKIEIKDLYHINETFTTTLSNISNNPLFYYVSVESRINKEWREIIDDINYPQVKISRISELKAKDWITISFSLETVLTKYFPCLDTFRLKINYGSNTDSIINKAYSKSFRISKF